MSTAAKGGFAVLAAIALQFWLFNDSTEPPQLAKKFNATYDYIVGKWCVIGFSQSVDLSIIYLSNVPLLLTFKCHFICIAILFILYK